MNNEDLLEVQRRLQIQHGIAPPSSAPDPATVAEGMLDMAEKWAEKGRHSETEYLDEETGLLRCKICNGPRQTVIQGIPQLGIPPRTVGCWCKCPTEYNRLKDQERADEITRNRVECFRSMPDLSGWTFDRDDGKRPELMQAARKYVDLFQEYARSGRGLLFYGDVDGGKSVAAACIANALISQGKRPKMTSLSIEADKVWAAEDKAEYIRSLCSYDLLIFDDLGVERKTEYMQEMVYKIVNARYTQGGPMIVTTNLTKEELGKPAEIEYRRIYSRILENCLAIHVESAGRRLQQAGANKIEMRKQLGIGGAGS